MKLYSHILQQTACIVETEGVGEILGKVLKGYESLINEFIENQSLKANREAINAKLYQLEQSKLKIESDY